MTPDTPHNLLPVSRTFTGREAEVAALLEHLGTQRVTWLSGPAGIGKTELARAVGHRAREEGLFPGGVHHLSLEGAGSVVTLMGDLVFTLGIDETRAPKAVFEGPPRLVIWDQMDGVLARRPERVREVLGERLAEAEALHHLVICREGAPEAATMVLDGLSPEAAFQAFVNHLPDSVSARPEPGDAALAAALEALDGNPMAIRLASRWCRPPRWTDVLPEGLAAGTRDDAGRRDAVGRGLALALDDLGEPASRLLGLLNAFPGGALENTLHDIHGDEWQQAATQLETTGLSDAVGGRHVPHPSVRLAVPALLGQRRTEMLWAQAAVYLHHNLVECRNHFKRGESDSPMRFMIREWENLRATFTWAVERLREDTGIDEDENARIVVDHGLALFHMFFGRRMFSEGLEWITTCIDAAERVDLESEKTTLTDYAGLFQVRLGDPEAARRSFAEALAGYREAENKTGIGSAAYHLGLLHYQQGDLPAARESFETATEVLRGLTDRSFGAQSATYLAQIQLADGDAEAAYETLTEALELYEERTLDVERRIVAHFTLAQAAALTDRPEESLTQARTAVQAAFMLHPRGAGAAIPHILKLTDTYVRLHPELIGPFVQDVASMVSGLQKVKPKPEVARDWQLASQLLTHMGDLLTRVNTALGPETASDPERARAREGLPEAARNLDKLTGGVLGVESWVSGRLQAS